MKIAKGIRASKPVSEDIELADLSVKKPKPIAVAPKQTYSLEEVHGLLNQQRQALEAEKRSFMQPALVSMPPPIVLPPNFSSFEGPPLGA